MDINNDIDTAIVSLETAIVDLRSEASRYYRLNDNYRGNIRYDAAADLELKLNSLKISAAYISKALAN